MAKTIKIKLLNKVDNVPGDQLIKAFFKAETSFNTKRYDYAWECKGVKSITQTPQIILTLPSFYCNTPITVRVVAQKKKLFNLPFLRFSSNVEIESKDDEPLPSLIEHRIYDNFTFTPTCFIKFVSIDWCDNHGIPKYIITPLPVMSLIYVCIKLEGLNGKEFTARIYNQHHEFVDNVKVFNNILSFCFFCSARFLNKKTKENLTLDLIQDKKTIFQFKKEIELPKQIVTKLDSFPLQTVTVGTVNIIENNYKPCKYSTIKIKNEEEEVSVFNETLSTSIHPYPIIAGESEKKITITLGDFDVSKCTNSTKHKALLKNTTLRGVEYQLTPDNCDIPLVYNYGLGSVPGLVPLQCIMPASNFNKQTLSLLAETCRHSKHMNINIYPDIEWSLAFSFSLEKEKKEEIDDKDTKKKTPFSKKLELSIETKWNNGSSKESATLNLNGISGTSHDLKKLLENEFKNRFGSYIETLIAVSEFITEFSDAQSVGNKIAKNKQYKGEKVPGIRKRKIADFEILWPSFEISFAWQAAVAQHNVGYQLTASGEGTLFGIEMTLDIFALASKITYIKAFVTALDIAAYFLDAEFSFDLIITGKIDFEGEIEYNGATDEVNSSLEVAGKLEVKLSLKVSIKSSETQKILTPNSPDQRRKSEFEAGGEGEAGIKVFMKIEPGNDGVYGYNGWQFTGLTFSLYAKQKVKNEGDGIKQKGDDVIIVTRESSTESESKNKWEVIPPFPTDKDLKEKEQGDGYLLIKQ
ncbi:MAG: hypothetical protein JXR39_11680 [Marinilabiliaceae bacterium]|nr:hypothetical protein [Marinilabiliaceae bacterium]